MFGKKSDSKKGKVQRSKQADQLFKACELGRTNDVHKLLQISGTSFYINVMNDNGLTPLHLAAESATTASDANMFNYLSICKMLLDSGADPNVGTLVSRHEFGLPFTHLNRLASAAEHHPALLGQDFNSTVQRISQDLPGNLAHICPE